MAYHRTVAVACVLANLLFATTSTAGQARARFVSGPPAGGRIPLVRLHVLDTAPLPSAVMSDAETEATEVYHAAGVALEWTDGLADTDSNPTTASEPVVDLRVIVVAGEAERRLIEDSHLAASVLGFAPTKRDCFCGRNAYIFSDRIMAVGYRRGNPSSLLGRVLAHEVGHLLLSRDSHSPTGIMRATLDTDLSFQPHFTNDDVKALVRGCVRLQTNGNVSAANGGGSRP